MYTTFSIKIFDNSKYLDSIVNVVVGAFWKPSAIAPQDYDNQCMLCNLPCREYMLILSIQYGLQSKLHQTNLYD